MADTTPAEFEQLTQRLSDASQALIQHRQNNQHLYAAVAPSGTQPAAQPGGGVCGFWGGGKAICGCRRSRPQ